MNAHGAAILSDPDPCSHIVYPYSDTTHIGEAVSVFAAAGLGRDESVVLITTKQKRDSVESHLREGGVDIEGHAAAGRLVFFDAEGMLGGFSRENDLDADAFMSIIGDVLETARRSSPSGKVRAYGEMVNLLCGKNDLEAAALLEAWWNEIIQLHSISLLCSYSLDLLQPHEATGLPKRLLDAHTHVLTA